MGSKVGNIKTIVRGVLYRLFQHTLILAWHILWLGLFLRHHKFDRLMVINGGYPASLICRSAILAWWLFMNKSGATLNIHNSPTATPWYFFIQEWLIDRAVIYCASAIITVSQYCLGTIRSRAAFSKTEKLTFIHNGISDPLNESIKPPDSFLDISHPFCLMLATYELRKGHEHLIRAFRIVVDRCPGTVLLMYGFGSVTEQERIQRQINNYRLENCVHLCGFTGHTSWLIQQAEMVVVPSQAYESFGLTIIEAMALSTPVVVTDTGGMPEVVSTTGAGLVCIKQDVPAFANAMVKLLRDPTLRAEMGGNGRLAFEGRYTAVKMAKSYYKQII